MNVLLVLADEGLYALPLHCVVEVVRSSCSDVKSVKEIRAITVRDRVVPLVWLTETLASRSGPGVSEGARSLDEATRVVP